MIVWDQAVYGSLTVGDLIVVVVTLVLVTIATRILSSYLKRILTEKISDNTLNIFLKTLQVGVMLFVLIVVLPPQLDLDLSGLLVAGGVAGIVIGFASQSVVSNFLSGMLLIVEHPIKIGDEVMIANVTGYVEDIHIMSTHLRTYDGVFVRMPNQMVFQSSISNYVTNPARRIEYTFGIRYRDDADRAIAAMGRVVADHPFVLTEPEPRFFVSQLAESSVELTARIWTPSPRWERTRNELLLDLKRGLEEEGIEFPYPQREVRFIQAPSSPSSMIGLQQKECDHDGRKE
jgi:small-conductance mechanosensitive channel